MEYDFPKQYSCRKPKDRANPNTQHVGSELGYHSPYEVSCIFELPFVRSATGAQIFVDKMTGD
jgi:hypothetical protein